MLPPLGLRVARNKGFEPLTFGFVVRLPCVKNGVDTSFPLRGGG